MTARFPVSATSVAYQINATWASKIHVLYWPAGADSLHRLRTGEAATTVITRASSGATYNATDGRIEGTSTVSFTDSISGGYGGLRELDNYTAGVTAYGDMFNGVGAKKILFGSLPASDGFDGGFKMSIQNYVGKWGQQGTSGSINLPGLSDNVVAISSSAMRHNQSDPTNTVRMWDGGTEVSSGYAHTPSSTSLLGDTARPFYIGSTFTGTGNTKFWFEAAWFGAGSLTDAEMVLLTNDPSQMIEAAGGADTTAPVLSTPTGTQTGSATATVGATTDEANGTMYGVVTVSGTAPSVAQIQAGQDNSGAAAAYASSQSIATTGAKTFSATGLSASTAYYAHIQHKDAATNESTVVTSAQFTTAAGAGASAQGAGVARRNQSGINSFGLRR
jgi:hypothetical protein